MRCMYREKKFYCGDYLEVDIFPVYEAQRGRGKKRKPTSETQAKLNQRNAERKLIRLLNTNFSSDDIRLDLTYSSDNMPDTPELAQRFMQNFIRRVKNYRKKQGLPALKYVAVTEIGSKNGRPHHHIVMSGDMSIKELARIWGMGYTTVKPLQFDKFGITGIAIYLNKAPILGKRWCASRNLKQPKESQRDGVVSAKKIKKMSEDENVARELCESLYNNYLFADCKIYHNEVNGGNYVTVRMYKNTALKKVKKRN